MKKRILIVDDSEDNRFLLLAHLKKLSFDLIQAENGLQALDRLSQDKVDLILMDIQMPEMDGCVATKKIREWEALNNRQPVPVIAISASTTAEDKRKSLAAGCTEYLTKPISKAALMDIVRRYT